MITWEEFESLIGQKEDGELFGYFINQFAGVHVSKFPEGEAYAEHEKSTYYQLFNYGFDIIIEAGSIRSINVYILPRDGYSPYAGTLPDGIKAGMREQEIIGYWGEGDKMGGGYRDGLLGQINRWVKYERGNLEIRFEFDDGGLLCMISVISHPHGLQAFP